MIQRETELQNRNLDIVGGAAADMKKMARVRRLSCCDARCSSCASAIMHVPCHARSCDRCPAAQ